MAASDGISARARNGVTRGTVGPEPSSPGWRLWKCRTMQGLTRVELGRQVGVTALDVGRWERGAARPAPDQLEKLSALYAVSGVYLMEDN